MNSKNNEIVDNLIDIQNVFELRNQKIIENENNLQLKQIKIDNYDKIIESLKRNILFLDEKIELEENPNQNILENDYFSFKLISCPSKLIEKESILNKTKIQLDENYKEILKKKQELEKLENVLKSKEIKDSLKEKEIDAKKNYIENSLQDFSKKTKLFCEQQKQNNLDEENKIIIEKENKLQINKKEMFNLYEKFNKFILKLPESERINYKNNIY